MKKEKGKDARNLALTAWTDAETKKRLEAAAKEEERSVSWLVEKIVKDWLASKERGDVNV